MYMLMVEFGLYIALGSTEDAVEARIVNEDDPLDGAGSGCRVGFLRRELIADADRLQRVLGFQFYQVKMLLKLHDMTHIRRFDHENKGVARIKAVLNHCGDDIPPAIDDHTKMKSKRSRKQLKSTKEGFNGLSALSRRIKKEKK